MSEEAKIVEDVETIEIQPQENNELVEEIAETPEETAEEEQEQSISLSDEDIEQDLSEKKDRVQKRIDKLTAEKYGALDEVEKLKRELEEIKSQVTKKEEAPQYTNEQLNDAIALGMEEGNPKLVVEAIQHLIKNAKQEALQDRRKCHYPDRHPAAHGP